MRGEKEEVEKENKDKNKKIYRKSRKEQTEKYTISNRNRMTSTVMTIFTINKSIKRKISAYENTSTVKALKISPQPFEGDL